MLKPHCMNKYANGKAGLAASFKSFSSFPSLVPDSQLLTQTTLNTPKSPLIPVNPH
jgi:hypothetical protein